MYNLFANSERNQQYESITSELCKLMQQYDRKKNPFDIDITEIVNDLNAKKLAVTKREDDYYKFINNTLFNHAFIESIKDESVQGLSLITFTNNDNKQSVNEYMKILKDKHYLLSKTLLCLTKQAQAVAEMDADLAETLNEYINRYLRSKQSSRIELYNWISVQNERIELMNNRLELPEKPSKQPQK